MNRLTPVFRRTFPHDRCRYSSLTSSHVQTFERILGHSSNPSSVLTDSHDVEAYNTDWLRQFRGNSRLVLRPSTTAELSAVVRVCYENRLPICFQGGNTGLVGGSVPVGDEIVVSTTRMNKVESFDPESGVLICQAGCVLETLDKYVEERGYMVPLDLGAKASCQIGGNVATGAGGVRLIRYGSLHAHVLGLEAVIADGRVLNMCNSLRKDNTSFHLPHLFIGSEGQLGAVSRVVLTCVPRPASVNVAFLGCKTFENCRKILPLAKSELGEILSSYEFMDRGTVDCVEEHLKFKSPLANKHNFYILVETMGADTDHDSSKLTKFLETVMQRGLVDDGVTSSNVTETKKIWQIRDTAAEALKHDGYVHKCDVSLPLSHFYQLVEEVRQRAHALASRTVGYGHLADGNLHLNITEKKLSMALSDRLFPFIYDWTAKHGGSISAEHGIGVLKKKYWHYCKSKQIMETMADLKRSFDPKLLFNPGKTLVL